MALVSSKVAAGMKVLADHFNKLREDLLTNHDHSSGKGGTVDHGDLADGVISGTALDHEHINLHVQGSASAAAPDNPGGDQGVHGLNAASYVAGALGSQFVVFAGHLSGSLSSGTCYFSADGTNVSVVTFDATPLVFCQIACNTYQANEHRAIVDIDNVTTTSFDYRIDSAATVTDLYFFVIGTKA